MVNPMVLRPRLKVGAVIARSFKLALTNAALLLPIAIVAEALRQTIDWILKGDNPLVVLPAGDLKEQYNPIGPLLELPHDLVAAVETAAIVWIAYSMLARRPTSFGDTATAVGRQSHRRPRRGRPPLRRAQEQRLPLGPRAHHARRVRPSDARHRPEGVCGGRRPVPSLSARALAVARRSADGEGIGAEFPLRVAAQRSSPVNGGG